MQQEQQENKESIEVWKVDEIEAMSFDENGQKEGDWKGYCVCKDGDEANYSFDMRNHINAQKLCDFLNDECIEIDDSIDAFVMDNCIEWSNLISQLSNRESQLNRLKEKYDDKEFKIVYQSDIDFKTLYGSTSEKVRKPHAKIEL